MSLFSRFFAKHRAAATAVEAGMIGAEELACTLVAEPWPVLDVRNPDEFNGPLGHIRSALNIPLASLAERVDELRPYRQQTLVVVCLSEKRSAQAIDYLRGAGFEKLVLLRGGMKDWTARHLPVATE